MGWPFCNGQHYIHSGPDSGSGSKDNEHIRTISATGVGRQWVSTFQCLHLTPWQLSTCNIHWHLPSWWVTSTALFFSFKKTTIFLLSPSDPPYPKPEAFSAEVLENKTVILTWVQPEDIFDEQNFTYIIMALVSDQQPSEERVLTLAHSDSPREEFNMTQVEDCSEVMFTLIQLGDCREQQLITAIPICEIHWFCIMFIVCVCAQFLGHFSLSSRQRFSFLLLENWD